MKSISRLLAVSLVALLGACVNEVGTISGGDDPGGGGDEDEEDTPPPTTPVLHSILSGTFSPIGTYTGISGRAQLVRSLDGRTDVDMQLVGVTPDTGYVAHVHAQPCAYQGGGHYMIDPSQTVAMETNELWLDFTSSAMGVGTSQATWTHMARGDALSIVVHDPAAANAKMACADLAPDDPAQVQFSGSVTPLALAAGSDLSITGAASALRSGATTHVELMLEGLDPAALYGTHVHALPCSVTDGGLHYKIDPTVVDALETNEVWIPVTDHADGSMLSEIDVTHAMRADAQSIVVHRLNPDDTKPKIACTDLTRTYPGRDTTGVTVLLPDGNSRLPSIDGSATMERSLAGWTRVAFDIAGLTAGTDYKAHVHNQPCSVENGGGHYMIDPAGEADLEENEMWLYLSADDTGAASDSMWIEHLARSEAQSVVIHDPTDKARLACIDLQ
jgi:hypothetical protein